MTRVISFDLDKCITGFQSIQDELPRLIGMAGSAASSSPQVAAMLGMAQQYIPVAGMLATMVGKFLGSENGKDGLTIASVNTGMPGKGRYQYLAKRKRFTSEQVCRVVESVAASNLPMSKQIVECINHTLAVMLPDVDTYSDNQTRQAIDLVIEHGGGLSEDTYTKLGDIVWTECNTMTASKTNEPRTKEE